MKLYPQTFERRDGLCYIGGISIKDLVQKYYTPLYIVCAQTVKSRVESFKESFKKYLPFESRIAFAGKSLCVTGFLKKLKELDTWLDVVSGGELYTAIKAGFDMKRIYFHGNNKSFEELEFAIKSNVGYIVVDGFSEIEKIRELSKKYNYIPCMIRISPGIEAHTHEFIKTGKIDSKFGFPIGEDAIKAVKELSSIDSVKFKGIHAHIGSQIFDSKPYVELVNVMFDFANKLNNEGFTLENINFGGGFGIAYTEEDYPLSIEEFVKDISLEIVKNMKKYSMKDLAFTVEPGRSIAGPSGITVYRVGSIKKINGFVPYVAVDGGMADNPRYALYKAKYHAELDEKTEIFQEVKIVGRFCESGDMLIEKIMLPEVNVGDLLLVFATGAYNYSMASNYNRFGRPAMVMVEDGKDTLIVRRETYEDIVSHDM
ncbi:diaminopimelate decarboxylase [Thermodesulfobium acidiphilum]|uniref:Diaminopimelate decarboxylase n=1 Tax=Thermodesulfobium acidiphilum TaxID=1794699 RepID=A0A2R4VY97_THEAF|nr:diaminopimelate decarboxylase [Thermodesulfobium acidiphilum]AWB09523.1 diaminopimelate decarboxylase [Thermodesulfobium acidiphilum]